MHKHAVLILLAGVVAVCGCRKEEEIAPAGARAHYANPNKNLSQYHRVILVEPINLSTNPQISVDLTNGIARALERKNLFGLTVIYRKDDIFTKYQLEYEKSPLETLKQVHKDLACDAILTGTIRDYQSYPRLAVSMRLRMVDLNDGELLWAMEQVWDSTDQELAKRMKGFFKTEMTDEYQPLNWRIGLISPNIFNKFVCFEVGETVASSHGASSRLYRPVEPATSK
jgi:TolB-like protein